MTGLTQELGRFVADLTEQRADHPEHHRVQQRSAKRCPEEDRRIAFGSNHRSRPLVEQVAGDIPLQVVERVQAAAMQLDLQPGYELVFGGRAKILAETVTNFLTALHLQGFGAKTLAGRKCTHPAVRDAFCGEGEQLAAFICIGTPTRSPQPRDADDPDAVLSRWEAA